VAGVTVGAVPQNRAFADQFIAETVKDHQHDFARVERSIRVRGGWAVADTGAALVTVAGEIALHLLGELAFESEVHPNHVVLVRLRGHLNLLRFPTLLLPDLHASG
jgi:hypothetical protein